MSTLQATLGDSRPPLTRRQDEVLRAIRGYIEEHGYPPSIREIGALVGIRSTNGVSDHLRAIERKGYLARGDHRSRALAPLPGDSMASVDSDTIAVPLLGRIAAGTPILAVENPDDTIHVDRFFLGSHPEPIFALRVVGESMIGDGIFDGDYIFVRKRCTARPGEIVVAMIQGEATVKHYYPEGDRVRFQPSNPEMQPIYVSASDFRPTHILGIVAGIYRKL